MKPKEEKVIEEIRMGIKKFKKGKLTKETLLRIEELNKLCEQGTKPQRV